ncbi:hypothetical protein [Clostridium butyricum]|uniref:hypothetical protein n=1 Tax=Clostridium butyricum TaxID=1492 RepID=UPI0013CF6A1D|nr:hypothetical protein [Clostridium butyricum]MCQ2017867.1 hypothetical protein [Clostridium butyricum]MCQ2022556.1 hypothetical protein [Clostridium butyricum]NFB71598.1 hypothetical protein [Clostridium butyricum]NFB92943.1 hypothetical protein [Clostridium butyricum]UTY55109.1 hypothetical protein HNS01_18505 [Clostridium butyricum]
MAEKIDEKILDFINAEEKIEKQKDIISGKIKIIDKYYEFKEKDFYDGNFKIYIPMSFDHMDIEMRKLKYPSESRPEIILCNEEGSIVITLNLINSMLSDEYVEKIRDFMKDIGKRINPSDLFLEEGMLLVNEKSIGFYDYKSSAIDDFIYNLVFILEFKEKTLMGTFSCPYEMNKEWRNIAFEIIKTIEIDKKNIDTEKKEKIIAKINHI